MDLGMVRPGVHEGWVGQQAGGDQAIDDTERERRNREYRDQVEKAVVGDQPQSRQKQLAPDMGECGKNTPAYRAKPAAR